MTEKDKELRKMVGEMLAEEDKGFNDWEIEFLDAMYLLTAYAVKQAEKIVQVYESKM